MIECCDLIQNGGEIEIADYTCRFPSVANYARFGDQLETFRADDAYALECGHQVIRDGYIYRFYDMHSFTKPLIGRVKVISAVKVVEGGK